MKKFTKTGIGCRKRVLRYLLLFASLSIALLQGCSTAREQGQLESEPDSILRVGLTLDLPLFVNKDKDGKLKGVEVDLLTRYAKKNNLLLDMSIYSRDELFFALRRGEIDIAAPSTTNTIISGNFLQPCAPHLKTGQRILVNSAVSMFIQNREQLNNKKITVLTAVGSTAANFARKIFPEAKLISLRDMKSCIKRALTDNGNIIMLDAGDAYILQSKKFILNSPDSKKPPQALNTKLKVVLPPLTDEEISWAVRRGDRKLRNSLDSFISDMKKNGKLTELIEQYNADIINE
jgi:ABC-type amino acid transport substrate-binding protein